MIGYKEVDHKQSNAYYEHEVHAYIRYISSNMHTLSETLKHKHATPTRIPFSNEDLTEVKRSAIRKRAYI